jgi:hypothetical protein
MWYSVMNLIFAWTCMIILANTEDKISPLKWKGVVCFQQDNPRSLIAYATKDLLQKSQFIISLCRLGLWTF